MNKFIVLGLSLTLLAGCNTLKRATGQIDDSTLPGQRTDILPQDQTTARDPAVVGNAAVTQTPIDGAEMPGMPKAKVSDATASCDPAVDLCPEPLAPEPVPPPSIKKPKVVDTTKADKATTAGKVVAGTEVVDGTKVPATPTVVPKKKKKKLVVPKVVVPGVPTPPVPQGQ
jgi:hypothetical protein